MPMNELGFYTLAGAPKSPAELIGEVRDAEAQGIGACFISERLNIKEAATICGAVGAVSTTIGIATAATHHNTRHPMVTAAHAMTMSKLTGNRYSLGLGRGIDAAFRAYGLPPIKTAQLEDFAGLMRRLWRGETVIGQDGPCGRYPVLSLVGRQHGRYPPDLRFRFRPQLAGARRAGDRGRGGAAHLLHRRDHRRAACGRVGQQAAEARRP